MSYKFVRRNLFTKSPLILFFRDNTLLGHSTYSIIDSNVGCINNLYIEPEFRKQQYGSTLLKYTEDILKYGYYKDKCDILVHSEPHDHLLDFFRSNNYNEKPVIHRSVSSPNYNVYDDGATIFTLIPMQKYLK